MQSYEKQQTGRGEMRQLGEEKVYGAFEGKSIRCDLTGCQFQRSYFQGRISIIYQLFSLSNGRNISLASQSQREECDARRQGYKLLKCKS